LRAGVAENHDERAARRQSLDGSRESRSDLAQQDVRRQPGNDWRQALPQPGFEQEDQRKQDEEGAEQSTHFCYSITCT
jgi:hypothetical protein